MKGIDQEQRLKRIIFVISIVVFLAVLLPSTYVKLKELKRKHNRYNEAKHNLSALIENTQKSIEKTHSDDIQEELTKYESILEDCKFEGRTPLLLLFLISILYGSMIGGSFLLLIWAVYLILHKEVPNYIIWHGG